MNLATVWHDSPSKLCAHACEAYDRFMRYSRGQFVIVVVIRVEESVSNPEYIMVAWIRHRTIRCFIGLSSATVNTRLLSLAQVFLLQSIR